MKLGFIKKILHAIGDLLKGEFEFAKQHAQVAVKVVNAIKAAVESPIAGVLVDLTPFKWDNDLLATVRIVMNKASEEMLVAEGILGYTNTNEAAVALIHYLQTKTKNARVKFWMELSAKITEYLADGKLSLAEAASISQAIYEELFGATDADNAPEPAPAAPIEPAPAQ